jgi:hypothetical protein
MSVGQIKNCICSIIINLDAEIINADLVCIQSFFADHCKGAIFKERVIFLNKNWAFKNMGR